MSPAAQSASAPRKRAAGLYTIITIKAGKGLLLLALALGLFSLMGDDLRSELDRFLRFIRFDPETEFWAEFGRKLRAVTPENLRFLASGTLLYAVLLFVESVGLSLRAYWAVWMAIGETAFFIPIEVFDLVQHPSWLVTVILLVNTLIVLYLVRNRNRLFPHHPH